MTDSRTLSLKISLDKLESVILRVGLICAAVFCIQASTRLWESGAMLSFPDATAFSILNHLVAFALLILSTRKSLSPSVGWAIPGALSLAFICLLYISAIYRIQSGSHARFTDVYLFGDYAARLLRLGENPYTHNLFDTYRLHRMMADATPLLGDFYTGRVAYPSLAVLIFVPFQWLGLPTSWIYPLFLALTLIVLFVGSPRVIRPLVLLPFFADEHFLNYAIGGVSDTVWIFFLVMMILAWRRETVRALWFGLAVSFKQQVWLLAPLLLIRVWKERNLPPQERLQSILRLVLPSVGVFLLFNAPFMLWDFEAWLSGVLEPFRGNLIILGQGLSSLTVFGYTIIPHTFFTIFTLAVYGLAIFLYWRHYDQWPEALWIIPGITMWFAPRSLSSYWYFFPIPLLFALVRHSHTLSTPHEVSRFTWRWTPSAIASTGLAAGIAMLVLRFGAYPPNLSLTVQEPLITQYGTITELSVLVDNQTGHALTPRFSVEKGGQQPLFWNIKTGPDILPSGQSALYNLSSDTASETFFFTSDVRLIVSDVHDYGLRAAVLIQGDTTVNYADVIPNGEYRFWDSQSNVPLLWGSYSNSVRTVSIERVVNGDLEHSLRFNLQPTPRADFSDLLLDTYLPLPEVPIEVWVKPPAEANHLPDLDVVYGFQLIANHTRVWVLFGDETTAGMLDESEYYWMIPANRESWNRIVLDLRQIYEDLNITLEPQRTIMPRFEQLEYPLVPLNFQMLLRTEHNDPLTAYFGPVRTMGLRPTNYDAMVQDNLAHPETMLLWEAAYQAGARNTERAREAYEQLLAIVPDSPQVLFQVADLELRTNEFERAIAHYEQAIEDNLRPGMAYKGIGWARFGLGEYDAALEAFNQAAVVLAEHDNGLYEPLDVADAYAGMGQVYLRRGQCFEAAIAFEQADINAPADYLIPLAELNACGPLFGTPPEPE